MADRHRPLLALDVDGPLNPYDAKATQRPDGYVTRRLHGSSFTDSKGRLWTKGGLRIWLNPAHGPMLLALADAGLVELVWATTWEADANTLVGPVLGLPALPVIALPRPTPQQWPTGRIWKRDAVERYAAGRALAWFDDDFVGPADFEWADKRTAAGTPTLLAPISPRIGIVQADVDAVADWAREVGRG